MKSSTAKTLALVLVAGFLASAAAFAADVPLGNWTVPPYHPMGAQGGLSTMGDITPGVAFVGIDPCRLVDTRQAGFPATYGQPALVAGAPRNFDLNSQPNCPGIPAGVEAYSLNFTVTNAQGTGFLKVFPQGGSIPVDISTLNYVAGVNIANAAIVPAGTGGGITVIAGVSGTDLIIDINGYFTDEYNANNRFLALGSCAGCAMILGDNSSATSGSHAIGGFAGGSGTVHGVQGQIGSGAGIGSSGVHGIGAATTLNSYGVFGETSTTASRSAGVLGSVGGAAWNPFNSGPYGVRGISQGGTNPVGVGGEGINSGGMFLRVDATGVLQTRGFVGHAGSDGFFTSNNLTVVGTKSFLEPHASDPTKVIKYVALEGPEAGTYFRGQGRLQRGLATIEIPSDFQTVTDPESLSVLITPIGEMTTVAVLAINPERITVRGSRDVRFFYLVQGVRKAFRDFQPVQADESHYFIPLTSDEQMLKTYPAEIKRRLIENGTYREDGTVNLETAHRLGWDRIWAERERPAPAPTP